MKIAINGTSEIATLSLIDPKSGVDYVTDYIGNTGALTAYFDWDEERDAYVCDQDTYDWWDAVVTDTQRLIDRIHELVSEHGSDAVYQVIDEAGSVDLADEAEHFGQALDRAFGQLLEV